MNAIHAETVKARLRKEMKEKRKSLLPEYVQTVSRTVSNNLMVSPLWEQASTVLLYAGVGGEVDTAYLFASALEQGKRVGMPRCLSKERAMVFAECSSKEHLALGYYGLYEPLADRPLIELGTNTLAVFPGVAFTKQGARLGQGGGYYDTYFANKRAKNVTKVGLCYSFQIVESLPEEDWDVSVDALCTEEQITFCNK